MAIKRIAAINDIAGASRCSLTVALPILSAMDIHVCVLPTAILSNHTGYENFFFDDYTDKMPRFIEAWQKMGLSFDCAFSGFLGSSRQIEIVTDFFRDFDCGIRLVDPVMGDDGRIYSTYTTDMCDKMKHLAAIADVVTPNVTEASVLSECDYTGEEISDDAAVKMAKKIRALGCKSVVITGIRRGDSVGTYVFEETGEMLLHKAVPTYYSGTGDVFASVLCGFLTKGAPLKFAAQKASDFTARALEYTVSCGIDPLEGLCVEHFTGELSTY